MRLWFSLFLFISSVAYLLYGMNELIFINRIGRPGPGFFPAIVGVLLIIFTFYGLAKDVLAVKNKEIDPTYPFRMIKSRGRIKKDAPNGGEKLWPLDVAVTALLILLLIASLMILGAILSMVVFMLLLLTFFNREKMIFNIGYSIALPGFLFLLFGVLLNASLPKGMLGI